MKSKYKKILLSVLSVCLVAVSLFVIPSDFYAGERAEEGESFNVTVNFNFNSTLDYEKINVMVPPISEQIITSNGTTTMTSFYYYSGSKSIFTTSTDVYAYRISIAAPTEGFSSNNKQVLEQRYCFGSLDELQKVNVTYGNAPSASNYSSVWYVNNYQKTTLYMAVMSNVYSLYNGSTVSHPTVGINTSVVLTVTPYTIEDLTKDIYEELLQSNLNDSAIIDKLDDIYNSSSSTNTKLQQLYNIASTLNSNTVEIKNLLSIANSYLLDIKNEEVKQTSWLQKIWESLQNLIDPSDNQDELDRIDSEVEEQNSQIQDNINDSNDYVKPDTDIIINEQNNVINIGNNSDFVSIIRFICSIDFLKTAMVMTTTVALVGYVLFGKRG